VLCAQLRPSLTESPDNEGLSKKMKRLNVE
jgi:hypothetical protein